MLPKYVDESLLVPDPDRRPGHWLYPPTGDVFALGTAFRPDRSKALEPAIEGGKPVIVISPKLHEIIFKAICDLGTDEHLLEYLREDPTYEDVVDFDQLEVSERKSHKPAWALDKPEADWTDEDIETMVATYDPETDENASTYGDRDKLRAALQEHRKEAIAEAERTKAK